MGRPVWVGTAEVVELAAVMLDPELAAAELLETALLLLELET